MDEHEDEFAPVEKWCLGSTSPNKVVHRRSCSHARSDYTWAREAATDASSLAFVLVRSGAHHWHRGCRRCCADLNTAIAWWVGRLAVTPLSDSSEADQ